MSLLQPPATPYVHRGLTPPLPPLQNCRRYAHEILNPKSIPESTRADVLQLLRKYYEAVRVNGLTMSECSRTSAPPRSEASASTSITEMTFNFSMATGAVQQ